MGVLQQDLVDCRSPEIWQVPRPRRSRYACQMSERYEHYSIQFRGFETSRDWALRRLLYRLVNRGPRNSLAKALGCITFDRNIVYHGLLCEYSVICDISWLQLLHNCNSWRYRTKVTVCVLLITTSWLICQENTNFECYARYLFLINSIFKCWVNFYVVCGKLVLNPSTPGNAWVRIKVFNTVATDALVLKHLAISIHSVDKIFIVFEWFHTTIFHSELTTWENRITFWKKKWPNGLRDK